MKNRRPQYELTQVPQLPMAILRQMTFNSLKRDTTERRGISAAR